MSTELLLRPEKVHELCDDLESLWFVLLYEGLHFVKHNKPSGIRMTTIFDYVDVSPTTGICTGGMGKFHLYFNCGHIVNRVLDFESKPFTALVRKMYLRFKSLNASYMAQDDSETPSAFLQDNFRKLESCVDIKELFEEALSSEEWPASCDKVHDQYPPIGHLTPKQRDTIALSYANGSLVPSSEPPGVKRKREEDDRDPQVPETKRPKTGPPLWKQIWSKCTFLVRG